MREEDKHYREFKFKRIKVKKSQRATVGLNNKSVHRQTFSRGMSVSCSKAARISFHSDLWCR